MPIKPAELSSLIADIYDCALAPELWPGVLERVSDAIGAVHGALRVLDTRTGELRLNITYGGSEPWTQLYNTTYYAQVPTLPNQIAQDIDNALTTERMMSRADFDKSRFFLEWAKPQGFEDVVGVQFIKQSDRIAWSSYYMPRRLGPRSTRECEIVNLLSPHFRRAALIGDMLDMRSIEATQFRHVVDHLAIGVFLVDELCRLVHANAAGREMLEIQSPLREVKGKLSIAAPRTDSALKRLVASMGRSGTSVSRGGSSIPVAYADGRPGLIHILPQITGSPRRRLSSNAAAVLFVAPQSAEPPTLADAMVALYDLSPAESRVLIPLIQGLAPREIAAVLSLGEPTVRTHLRSLYAKTETSRQGELIALARDLVIPLRR